MRGRRRRWCRRGGAVLDLPRHLCRWRLLRRHNRRRPDYPGPGPRKGRLAPPLVRRIYRYPSQKRPASAEIERHDVAAGACHALLHEPRRLERGHPTHVLVARRVGIDGIGLEDVAPRSAGSLDRRVEQAGQDALAPHGPVHVEAHERPHLRLRHPAVVMSAQPVIGRPGRDRAPADRISVGVRQQADGLAPANHPQLQRLLAGRRVHRGRLGAVGAPRHAPTYHRPPFWENSASRSGHRFGVTVIDREGESSVLAARRSIARFLPCTTRRQVAVAPGGEDLLEAALLGRYPLDVAGAEALHEAPPVAARDPSRRSVRTS